MEIPAFKRKLTFTDDISAPCLKATLPNSSVPQLAARHIQEQLEEPEFEILLRSKHPAKMTDWQREMLERLLCNGELATAIETGMKDYRTQHNDLDVDYVKRNWADAEKNGVLPHVQLLDVIIDDIRRELILRLASSMDGNLEEHGAVIYLERGKWKFDADYIYDYLNAVEEEEGERKVPSDFVEEEDEPAEEKADENSEVSFLYGTWVFDAETNTAQLKSEGREGHIQSFTLEFEKRRIAISEKSFLWWYRYSPYHKPAESEILGCIRSGNKITLKLRDLADKRVDSLVFEYQDDRLRLVGNCTFKRKPD